MKNRLLLNLHLFSILALMAASCAPASVPIATTSDDFAIYRKQYNYTPERYEGNETLVKEVLLQFDSTTQKADITQQLNEFLDAPPLVVDLGLPEGLIKLDGWRIQIYRGRDRKAASEARQRSYALFPNLTPYMIYNAPRYQVRVGDFLEPYEYQQFLKAFKKEFPTALAVPDVVNIVVEKDEKIYPRDK